MSCDSKPSLTARHHPIRGLFVFILIMIYAALNFCGCITKNRENKTGNPVPGMNAVLWHQAAPEYLAATRTVFGNAQMRLDQALADPGWSALIGQGDNNTALPAATAIILDIDETVLNNSPLYARQVEDPGYPLGPGWGTWTDEANAEALAGAVDFIRYAVSKGVTVFFVSNRSCTQDDATLKNLQAQGFPPEVILLSRNTGYKDPDQVDSCPDMEAYAEKEFGISKPRWVSAKSYRRRTIAQKYRVLLQFGDSQGDFYSPVPAPDAPDAERRRLELGHLTPDERKRIYRDYGQFFKDRWFALPNPMYGNWQSSLLEYQSITIPQQVSKEMSVLKTD